MATKTVTVVERRLSHYRVPFFEALREQLRNQGIRFRLMRGAPMKVEVEKRDEGFLAWAEYLPTAYLLNERICIQPFRSQTRNDDLVIVNHENKLLCNLLALSMNRPWRFAFWGHGANLQSPNPDGYKERFKRWTTNCVDWYFAYTDMSVPLVESLGFPRERITVLNNTIDTAGLRSMRRAMTSERLSELRSELGLKGNQVGGFIGSLYEEKRIDFMLEAASEIRKRVPAFEFLIIGAGPRQAQIEQFCSQNQWARYLGMLKGQAKVEALGLTQVMINPGLVGLGILDSFVCGVPMLTTDCGLHSPEIAYLVHGYNGLMTENTLDAYVSAATALLNDPAQLALLRAGCEASATKYTIENMVTNFVQGTMNCLEAPPHRRGRALQSQ